MNKKVLVIFVSLLTSMLTACNKSNISTAQTVSSNTASELSSDISLTEKSNADNSSNNKTTSDVDLDLTLLSSTMVYSEVYNMMMSPDDYSGMTIRINGALAIGYSYNEDGTTDKSSPRFACIIKDATACCSQGLEFVLSGSPVYPDDYPELNSDITVVGTFEVSEVEYNKNTFKVCKLVNAELTCE